MRIVFVQKVKALVGSEKYFLELLPALSQKGIQTHFICVVNKADIEKARFFVKAFKNLDLSLSVIHAKSDRSIFKTIRAIGKEINHFQPDLVHSHLIHADFWCAILKKRKRIFCPVVSTKHGYDEAYIAKHGFNPQYIKNNRYYRMAKFAEKHIEHSYAVSKGLQKFYIESGICQAQKLDLIHHGFDLPNLDSIDLKPHRESEPQLIIIGRIIPFKGHQFMVEALPTLVSKYPKLRLVILGHGDEHLIQELKKRSDELGVSKNIEFLGYKANIYNYLKGSDIMVVPSVAEGFGLVFLEALNAKLPIVGFDVPATNEIIENEVNGYLTTPYNINELASNILSLLDDQIKMKSFGEAGFTRLKEYFSMKRMCGETISFYEKVLDLTVESSKKQ